MNKKLKWMLGVFILSATTLYATNSLVGTESDPLVSKSYIDKKMAEQEALITSLTNEIETLKQNGGSTYEIVVVPEGQIIYGMQGTEMIIRSGAGQIIASAVGGIVE